MKFGLTQELFTTSRDGGSDAIFPGGNQVDSLPPAPSNASREEHRQLGANIFMAKACFKHDVLRIVLSDLDEGQE